MGLINESQENTRYHSACSCAYSDSLPQKQSTRIETKMSGTTNALALTPSDASKILAAKMHYGGLNCKFQLKWRSICRRRSLDSKRARLRTGPISNSQRCRTGLLRTMPVGKSEWIFEDSNYPL